MDSGFNEKMRKMSDRSGAFKCPDGVLSQRGEEIQVEYSSNKVVCL